MSRPKVTALVAAAAAAVTAVAVWVRRTLAGRSGGKQ